MDRFFYLLFFTFYLGIERDSEIKNAKKQSLFVSNLKYIALFLGLMWLFAIVDLLLWNINSYGIHPRSYPGLIGILSAPFLHADLNQAPNHILQNTLFLLFLLPITLLFYPKTAKQSILIIILIGGTLVWLFARSNSNHIGASGLIFGLMTFLLFNGLLRRNFKALLSSILFLILYALIVYGVFPKNLSQVVLLLKSIAINFFQGFNPSQKHISWESHLFGALGGLVSTILYRNHSD